LEIFNANPIISNIRLVQNRKTYSPSANFAGVQAPDTFERVSVDKFFTEYEIRKMIAANPQIPKTLVKNGISLKLNMAELQNLKENHCRNVVQNAQNIASNLPASLKYKVNIKDLKEAALFHDFGKVLIPKNILNKTSSLTDEERNIMNLHSELGYQLLKTTGMSNEVLALVRYHHENQLAVKEFVPDINLQILNLADKYSALTEPRVYKKEYTPKQALTILYKEVKEGKIQPLIFQALVKSVSEGNTQKNITKI